MRARMLSIACAACVGVFAVPVAGQCQELLASDGAEGDLFGTSVSISGDVIVIGARGVTAVGGADEGAAYVFERTGGAWTETAKLMPDDLSVKARFGFSVDIHGDTIVVGAENADGSVEEQGLAFVYRKIGDEWQPLATLSADDPAEGADFGYSVAVEDGLIVVGAPKFSDGINNAGVAYVFEEVGAGEWSQVGVLESPDDDADYPGAVVDVENGMIAVGDYQADDAMVYAESQGGQWELLQHIQPAGLQPGSYFGRALAMSGTTLMVSAPREATAHGPDTGALHVFSLDGGTWVEEQEAVVPDAFRLGRGIGLSGDNAFTGSSAGVVYELLREAGVWKVVGTLPAPITGDKDDVIRVHDGTVVVGYRNASEPATNAGSALSFDLSGPDGCVADCDGDGDLDAVDFVCFQQQFQAGEDAADCFADCRLTILDFVCFQEAFIDGCP